MTPLAALVELLARVGVQAGAAVFVSDEELSQWPAEAVSALKSQTLLVKARPAVSVVCPGCEQECVRPVETVPDGPCGAASFVVCDRRSDINRVPVTAERITQWLCNVALVCDFVAGGLGIRRSRQNSADSVLISIGMFKGNKRSQMVSLRTGCELELVVGIATAPLAELLDCSNSKFTVDVTAISKMVDSSTIADPRHTPSNIKREQRKLTTEAMYSAWRKSYRKLRKDRPGKSDVWYSIQIAKSEIAGGRSAETIRKHVGR